MHRKNIQHLNGNIENNSCALKCYAKMCHGFLLASSSKYSGVKMELQLLDEQGNFMKAVQKKSASKRKFL